MIWTDDYLNQLAIDAEQQINQDLQCIYFKECFPVTQGTSVYTLPSYIRSIDRITWRGKRLDPVNWEDMQLLGPATVGGYIETSQSRPLFYSMHPSATYAIRFYPTPDESFTDTGDTPYSPTVNAPACIISSWRTTDDTGADPTLLLPTYIDRRTRKAYVAWKAFMAEGPGQNLKASAYYKTKYDFLINQFRSINEGCFIGQQYALDDEGSMEVGGFRYPRPTLPPNFPRTIY